MWHVVVTGGHIRVVWTLDGYMNGYGLGEIFNCVVRISFSEVGVGYVIVSICDRRVLFTKYRLLNLYRFSVKFYSLVILFSLIVLTSLISVRSHHSLTVFPTTGSWGYLHGFFQTFCGLVWVTISSVGSGHVITDVANQRMVRIWSLIYF